MVSLGRSRGLELLSRLVSFRSSMSEVRPVAVVTQNAGTRMSLYTIYFSNFYICESIKLNTRQVQPFRMTWSVSVYNGLSSKVFSADDLSKTIKLRLD
jgi:hypothetical protein